MTHLCKQGVILAAGMGTRLGVYGKDHPKSLYKFNGKTLIERNIESLKREGIEEIIVIGGYKIEMIEPVISKYDNVRLIYNDKYQEHKTMYSLGLAEEFIEECFIQTEADFVGEQRGLQSLLKSHDNAIICSEFNATSSVVTPVFDGTGNLVELSRSIKDLYLRDSSFNYVGPSHFTKDMLKCMKKHNENNENNLLYEDALAKSIIEDNFNISFVYINKFQHWDLNKDKDFEYIEKLINMLDGEVF